MDITIGRSVTAQGLVRALAGAAILAVSSGPASASGAWRTMLHPRDFTDLIVTDQVVWCATAEAGLLRFDRATHRFESITREPGSVASNHLTSLAYDRVGRLWVGTAESGVSRLAADGKTWELVNAFDGIVGDSVTTLATAGDTLWIGTRRGIALWDGRRVLGSLPDGNTLSFDTTFTIPAITGIAQLGDVLWLSTLRGVGFAHTTTNLSDWRPANAGLPTLAPSHLASDGVALFAQASGGLYQWDTTALRWLVVPSLGTVHSLKEDYGTVLVSTTLGIWRHRVGDPSFTLIAGSPVSAPADRDDPEPAVDPSGSTTHYAGSSAGIWEQPDTAGAWTLYTPPGPPGNTYCNIAIDGPRVYAATRSEGIGRWDGTSWFAWLPVGCAGACPNSFVWPTEVFAMLVDTAGTKWVSCWGFAFERFDDSVEPPVFTHVWTQTDADTVRHTLAFGAAADSFGGRWFGMDGFNDLVPLGLDYYDSTGAYAGTWGPSTPNSRVRAPKIRAVTVDMLGRTWVGYAGAANSGVDHFFRRPLASYDNGTVAGTTNLDIWSLVAYGDSIWVLTDSDLRRINRPTRALAGLPLKTPGGRPLGMRLMDVAPNGDVFVGSEEGVRWYHAGSTRTEDLTIANSPLASNDVRAIAVERNTGAVWFGTAAGLNRFDPAYVPPSPPRGQRDSLRVYPNPATMTGLGVELRLIGASSAYTGGIYDLRGRLLHRFSVADLGRVVWDGRDLNGQLARPGVYFVRADSGGRQARARFVLLH